MHNIIFDIRGDIVVTISVGTAKGGTGKTTFTFNITGTIASNGKRTLVIDNDAQSNITSAFNVNSKNKYTMYDLFLEKNIGFDDCIVKVDDNIDLVPNRIESMELDDLLANKSLREGILQRKLKTIPSGYDYVIIDNSPYVGTQVKNALGISDYYIGVVDTSIDALIGLQIFENKIKTDVVETYLNTKIKCLGVVWNLYKSNTNFSKEVEAFMIENLKDKLFETRLKDTVKFKEGRALNTTIDKYNCDLASDYNSIFNSIVKRTSNT